jgi:hypothetical protein
VLEGGFFDDFALLGALVFGAGDAENDLEGMTGN